MLRLPRLNARRASWSASVRLSPGPISTLRNYHGPRDPAGPPPFGPSGPAGGVVRAHPGNRSSAAARSYTSFAAADALASRPAPQAAGSADPSATAPRRRPRVPRHRPPRPQSAPHQRIRRGWIMSPTTERLHKTRDLQALSAMRMRGLEPPPGFPDTDLNRAARGQMCPPASRSSISWGFADASDASGATTVVKLLSPAALNAVSMRAWRSQLLLIRRGRLPPARRCARTTPKAERAAGPVTARAHDASAIIK
jgi:hypothetical protein